MSSLAAFAPAWRPRPLAGGALLSVLVHGLAIGLLAWQASRPAAHEGALPVARIATLWLLADTPPAARRFAAHTPSAAPAGPARRAPSRPPAPPGSVAARVAAAPGTHRPAQDGAAAAPVQGIAFAMPALRIGPGRMPVAPAQAPAVGATVPMPPGPPPQWLMQPAQQAALAQIGQQLQRRLAALPSPGDPGEGRCELVPGDPATLACDTPALQASVAGDAPALAGLLRAYRGLASQFTHVALAYAQQRFRLDAR